MTRPDTDRLIVTEEAKLVAREIAVRDYAWTDGYLESFAERADALRGTEQHAAYVEGSKRILEILDAAAKGTYDHGIWKELGIDPEYREDVEKCCNGIIRALR